MAGTAEAVDSNVFHKDLLGTTPAGKEIYLVRKHNCPLRTLAFGTGGELPEHLQGGYSSIKEAANAVTAYVESLVVAQSKKSKGRSTTKTK